MPSATLLVTRPLADVHKQACLSAAQMCAVTPLHPYLRQGKVDGLGLLPYQPALGHHSTLR